MLLALLLTSLAATSDGVEGPHKTHGVEVEVEVARCHDVAAGGIPRLLSCGKRKEADRQEGDEGTCTGINAHAFDLHVPRYLRYVLKGAEKIDWLSVAHSVLDTSTRIDVNFFIQQSASQQSSLGGEPGNVGYHVAMYEGQTHFHENLSPLA